MVHKKRVVALQDELITGIKEFISKSNIEELSFKTTFVIYVTEGFGEDTVRAMYGATGMRGDVVVAESVWGEGTEINLGELDIYELAHIMDSLESNSFEIIF